MSARSWWAAFDPEDHILYGTGLSAEDALDEARAVAMTLGCYEGTLDRLQACPCSPDLAEVFGSNADARDTEWKIVTYGSGVRCVMLRSEDTAMHLARAA